MTVLVLSNSILVAIFATIMNWRQGVGKLKFQNLNTILDKGLWLKVSASDLIFCIGVYPQEPRKGASGNYNNPPSEVSTRTARL